MSGQHRPSAPGRHDDARRRWRSLVLAQQRGALSQRAFCEREGVALSSFTRWRRLLLAETAATDVPEESAFVALSLLPAAADTATATPEHTALTLTLPGGLRIEGIVADSVETVAALVRAL